MNHNTNNNTQKDTICIIHPGSEMDEEERLLVNDYIDQVAEGDKQVLSLSSYPEQPSIEDIQYNISLIEKANEFKILWKKGSRELLFNFGMLFAARKVGSLLNESYVDKLRVEGINAQAEANMIAPGKTHENLAFTLQYYPSIVNLEPESKNKKSFMICPVRNAGQELEQKLKDFVEVADSRDRSIYYPKIHTDQVDPIGISICAQNRGGIEHSKEVIIYNQGLSEGTEFDKGMTIYLNKPVCFINIDDVKENPNGRFDQMFLKLHERYASEDRKRYRQIKEFAEMVGLIE